MAAPSPFPLCTGAGGGAELAGFEGTLLDGARAAGLGADLPPELRPVSPVRKTSRNKWKDG